MGEGEDSDVWALDTLVRMASKPKKNIATAS
jgi:hypothetical protein